MEQQTHMLRRHPRFVAELRVNVKFPNLEKLGLLYTRDISKGGLFIRCEKPLPVFSKIEVQLLPLGETTGLRLMAEVVHQIAPETASDRTLVSGMGVQFLDLDDEKRKRIEDFINGLITKLGPDEIVYPAERAAQVKVDPKTMNPEDLRRAYSAQFPDRVKMAEDLFAKSLEELQKGQEKQAQGSLRMAVQFDPFNEKLKKQLGEIIRKFGDKS